MTITCPSCGKTSAIAARQGGDPESQGAVQVRDRVRGARSGGGRRGRASRAGCSDRSGRAVPRRPSLPQVAARRQRGRRPPHADASRPVAPLREPPAGPLRARLPAVHEGLLRRVHAEGPGRRHLRGVRRPVRADQPVRAEAGDRPPAGPLDGRGPRRHRRLSLPRPVGLRAARAVHGSRRLFLRDPRPGRVDAVHVPRPDPRVERRPQELHAGRDRPRRADAAGAPGPGRLRHQHRAADRGHPARSRRGTRRHLRRERAAGRRACRRSSPLPSRTRSLRPTRLLAAEDEEPFVRRAFCSRRTKAEPSLGSGRAEARRRRGPAAWPSPFSGSWFTRRSRSPWPRCRAASSPPSTP